MVSSRRLIFIIPIFFLSSLIGCAGYGPAVHIHDRNKYYEVHVPVSKLALAIPKDGFIQKDNRHGGGTDSPTYFYFENNSLQIIISGWFGPEEQFPGINKVRAQPVNAYNRGGLQTVDVTFEKIGNWETIIYEIHTSNYRGSHIEAHWLQAGTWINLHMSIASDLPSSEARTKLINLLETIRVKQYR